MSADKTAAVSLSESLTASEASSAAGTHGVTTPRALPPAATPAIATTTASSPSASALHRRRPRLFYLDLVRALATFLIVLTHFNNPFLTDGRYLLTNQPFGLYVGDLGVSLFLIISGAALAYTYQRPVDLSSFYWKRFKGIYPMFWIAWLLGTIYFFIVQGGAPLNAAPARSMIWTVLGIDGWIGVFGVQTAYLLGEWFLGFIILFYLLFPGLLYLVERFPKSTAAGLLIVFVITWVIMRDLFPSVPGSIILTMRLPELAFGIYLVRYIKRVAPVAVVCAVAVLALNGFFPTVLPKDVATAVLGIAAFLLLVVLARYVAIGPVRVFIQWVAKYSYAIFLVHHVVIMRLFMMMDTSDFLPIQFAMMLLACLVIIVVLAVALEALTRAVVAGCTRAFAGQWWKPVISGVEP